MTIRKPLYQVGEAVLKQLQAEAILQQLQELQSEVAILEGVLA